MGFLHSHLFLHQTIALPLSSVVPMKSFSWHTCTHGYHCHDIHTSLAIFSSSVVIDAVFLSLSLAFDVNDDWSCWWWLDCLNLCTHFLWAVLLVHFLIISLHSLPLVALLPPLTPYAIFKSFLQRHQLIVLSSVPFMTVDAFSWRPADCEIIVKTKTKKLIGDWLLLKLMISMMTEVTVHETLDLRDSTAACAAFAVGVHNAFCSHVNRLFGPCTQGFRGQALTGE